MVSFHPPAAVELTGSGVAAGDPEHAFEAVAVGPHTLVEQPPPEHLAGEVGRERGDDAGVVGRDRRHALVERGDFGGQDVGGAVEQRDDVAPPAS